MASHGGEGFNSYAPSLAPFLCPICATFDPILMSLLLNFANVNNISRPLFLEPFAKIRTLVFLFSPHLCPLLSPNFLFLSSLSSILSLLFSLSYFVCENEAQCLCYVDDVTLFPKECIMSDHGSFSMVTVSLLLCL